MSTNLSIEVASHNKCAQHIQFYLNKNYVIYSMVIGKKTLSNN